MSCDIVWYWTFYHRMYWLMNVSIANFLYFSLCMFALELRRIDIERERAANDDVHTHIRKHISMHPTKQYQNVPLFDALTKKQKQFSHWKIATFPSVLVLVLVPTYHRPSNANRCFSTGWKLIRTLFVKRIWLETTSHWTHSDEQNLIADYIYTP